MIGLTLTRASEGLLSDGGVSPFSVGTQGWLSSGVPLALIVSSDILALGLLESGTATWIIFQSDSDSWSLIAVEGPGTLSITDKPSPRVRLNIPIEWQERTEPWVPLGNPIVFDD